jgi:hypothetical protein
MIRSPAPWPEAWTQEYVETIRQAITANPGTPEYARRLQILCEGFPLYWSAQRIVSDRSHFEVRQAQIRWYVEDLMNTELPGEEEKQTLRRQYEDLIQFAARSLLTQFPFLDPNMVKNGAMDYLADCYRSIDVPLLPVFLYPFSDDQMEQLKQRWYDARYVRVDLWQQLAGEVTSSRRNQRGIVDQTRSDYLLTQRSLDVLGGDIWAVVAPSPEYFQTAVTNALSILERRHRAMSNACEREMYMSMADIQTEYLSFLIATLLETEACRQFTTIQRVGGSFGEDCSLERGDPNNVGKLLPKE